jgi:O-antigen ligase
MRTNGAEMKAEKSIDSYSRLAFMLFVFSLPFSKAATSILIGVLLLLGVFRYFKSRSRDLQDLFIVLLPGCFFLLHLVGMMWTDNCDFGWFDIGIKVNLLLLPLSIWLHSDLVKNRSGLIFRWLTYAMLLGVAYRLILSTIDYNDTGDSSVFFYEKLGHGIHPSYLAFEADVLLVLLIFSGLFSSARKWAILFTLSVFVLFLNSKAGILLWFLAVPGSIVWNSFSGQRTKGVFLAIGVTFAFMMMYFVVSKVADDRVGRMLQTMRSDSVQTSHPESSGQRLLVWSAAWDLVKSDPWTGTGTGDVKDVLVDAYISRGMSSAAESRLNAHNQFLQSWLALGIAGIGSLLASFVLPLVGGIRKRDGCLVIFLLLAALNFSVESMLETQAGTVFFSFIYSVLLLSGSARIVPRSPL